MNLNGAPELPSLDANTALNNYLNTTGAGSTGGGAGVTNAHPITDPGDGGTIDVSNSGFLGLTHVTGSESRTLPDPTFLGQEIIVYLDEDLDAYGGRIDVNSANDFSNSPAHSTMEFDAVGQCAIFYAVQVGSSLRWRIERALNNEPVTG
jgi:hypothetical protein